MISTVRFFDKWFCWGIAPYPGVGGSARWARQSRGAFGAPGYEYSAFQARVVAPDGRVNPRVPSAPWVMNTAPSRRVW